MLLSILRLCNHLSNPSFRYLVPRMLTDMDLHADLRLTSVVQALSDNDDLRHIAMLRAQMFASKEPTLDVVRCKHLHIC